MNLNPILRGNQKRIAASCLGIWLFAFAIGVAQACVMLPAAHALEMSHSLAHHAQAAGGDEDVGCDKSCADGAPPLIKVIPSPPGFFGTQVFLVQTWTSSLLPANAVRAKAANHGGLFHSGASPRLPHLRLTL